MIPVDQQRIRRSRTGLVAHDPDRAHQGYTLFTPMFGDGTVYLLDMDGEVAHTWRMPYRPGLYGYLLDNGHLFYAGKVMDDLDRFEAWPRFKAGAALEVDWGAGALGGQPPRSPSRRAQVAQRATSCCCVCGRCRRIACARHPGRCAGHRGPLIYADYLVEMTTSGEIVWEWRSWEHLDPEAGSDHAAGPPRRVDARQHGRRDARGQHPRPELPQYLDRRA